jgi:hypothetical protein
MAGGPIRRALQAWLAVLELSKSLPVLIAAPM